MAECDVCELNFSNEWNLRTHVKRKHPDKLDVLCPRRRKPFDSGTIECRECGKKFIRLDNLRSHIKHKHSNKSEELLTYINSKRYICEECGNQFDLLGHLKKHKECHKVKKIIQLRCLLCDYVCSTRDILITHYTNLHNLEIENETYEFESLEAFQSWKSEMERRTFSKFINKRTKRRNQVAVKIEYYCHRSGHFKPRGANIRHLKKQGTNKINGYCPAKLTVSLQKGKYFAYYCGTHVGHKQEEDLDRLSLTKAERDEIAAKIASNVPLQVILNEMRDSVPECQLQRLHLLTKKDLYNIVKSYNLNASSVMDEYDAMSVEAAENCLDMDIIKEDQEASSLIETLSTARPKQQNYFDQVRERKQKLIDEMVQLQEELELIDSIEEIEVFERNIAQIRPSLAAVRNHKKSLVRFSKVSASIKNTQSNKRIEPQRLYNTKEPLQRKKLTLIIKNPSTQRKSVQLLLNDNLH